MSRSGYNDDCWDADGSAEWAMIRWRGAVESAIRGARGQAFLRELLDALDAMPEKRLIAHSFQQGGGCCTLGVIGASRGVPMPEIDPDDFDEFEDPARIRKQASSVLNIAPALAAEIMFFNDDAGGWSETPEQRWSRMRAWVVEQIRQRAAA